jgi:excinuclease ABC subunit C
MEKQAPKDADAALNGITTDADASSDTGSPAEKPVIRPRSELLVAAREASDSPGVYLMKDPDGGILYVGKAKNLKNRLASYFQAAVHEVPRTEMMVSRVERFDVILTGTEAEALILENTLIKKHKPKFNVRLKDDKTYPYLKIRVDEPYPRIEWTRRVLRDGARYFGPFPSAWSARQVMNLLNETFQLRDCSENTFRHRTRPCILFQMGKCSGGCVGKVNSQQYHDSINEVIGVLEGKSERLVGELKRGMEDAAEREEYERAAEYRDQIKSLELVTETQGVIEAGSQRDRDVVGLARKGVEAYGVVLKIRGGRMIGVNHYSITNADESMSESDLLTDFLSQYYLSLVRDVADPEAPSPEGEVREARPTEALVSVAPEDPAFFEKAMGLTILVGESAVEKQLLSAARSNAEYALEQAAKRTGGHGVEALEEVQEKLHLTRLPRRIECYDNSNIQGEDAVASRVVFIDGAPDKNLYRRYKVRTVEGSNDFATMKEILGRRFSNVEETLPDLVVVDGGKGQLSQAVAIMQELGIAMGQGGVAVVGLAKARTESDFKSSEVKSSHERIFIPGRKNPVPLLPHTQAYKLLTHVRDEAHRFAITYHRLVRSKRTLGKK